MRVTSGPALYERVRSLLIVTLFIGWGCWAFYDWQIGYLKKNHAEARKRLSQLVDPGKIPERLPDKPTEEDFEKLKTAAPTTLTAVRQALGEPFAMAQQGQGEAVFFFVSAYGMAATPAVGETVDPSRLAWTKWSKTKSEIDSQLLWGAIAVGIGLCFVPGMLKAFMLRVTIDDEGMLYAGQRIPFGAMKRFDNYSPKGWIDLIYEDGGREKRRRLDDHRVREFDRLIDEICKEKGFPDPRQSSAPAGTSA